MDNNTLWRALGHQHNGNEVLCTVVKIPAPVRSSVAIFRLQIQQPHTLRVLDIRESPDLFDVMECAREYGPFRGPAAHEMGPKADARWQRSIEEAEAFGG